MVFLLHSVLVRVGQELGSGDCFECVPEMPCCARPNAPECPNILVTKQFYCPENLRHRSFGGRVGMSVASKQLRKQLDRHQKNPLRILELEEEYQLTQR